MIRKTTIALLTIMLMVALASCDSGSHVRAGNYYPAVSENDRHINILSGNKLRLVGFDIDWLADYLISEGTNFRGEEAEQFKKNHNLPDVFAQEIEYEFDESDGYIYLRALSADNADYLVANFRMAYDGETITFLEEAYTRK